MVRYPYISAPLTLFATFMALLPTGLVSPPPIYGSHTAVASNPIHFTRLLKHPFYLSQNSKFFLFKILLRALLLRVASPGARLGSWRRLGLGLRLGHGLRPRLGRRLAVWIRVGVRCRLEFGLACLALPIKHTHARPPSSEVGIRDGHLRGEG